ncbi:MAG: GatB/YqeY domain-containing protein [Commensalibacter sp.]|nr:GatB/YqeY domain-containing protein [Commensalibacter sp.]
MTLRERLKEEVKTAMKAKDTARLNTLRMIGAKLKDQDIAARPKGIEQISDEEIITMLKGMVKSRRESVELYRQGNREELAEKEEAEIKVIEDFLPAQMNESDMQKAVEEAITKTGAASIKDMGKVMAILKQQYGAVLDMGKVNQLVKAKLN